MDYNVTPQNGPNVLPLNCIWSKVGLDLLQNIIIFLVECYHVMYLNKKQIK